LKKRAWLAEPARELGDVNQYYQELTFHTTTGGVGADGAEEITRRWIQPHCRFTRSESGDKLNTKQHNRHADGGGTTSMTWVIAGVIKSDKDAVNVSGEWEAKLLNEAYLTQRAGNSWDNRPIKRNSDSAYSYSLEQRRR
jgi:hypothetical protein